MLSSFRSAAVGPAVTLVAEVAREPDHSSIGNGPWPAPPGAGVDLAAGRRRSLARWTAEDREGDLRPDLSNEPRNPRSGARRAFMVSCSSSGLPCRKRPFLTTCEDVRTQDHSGGRLSSGITFCCYPIGSIRSWNTGIIRVGTITFRRLSFRHPSGEAQSEAGRYTRLFGNPRPGCAMSVAQDWRNGPEDMAGTWSYACRCDRPRMQFDIGSELLTSVPHQYRRIRFLTLPERFEW